MSDCRKSVALNYRGACESAFAVLIQLRLSAVVRLPNTSASSSLANYVTQPNLPFKSEEFIIFLHHYKNRLSAGMKNL